MGISEEKADLRTRYRRERSERYLEHSFEHLADIAEIAKATTIASYISYADEPDTRALNLQLINQGKILLLPRIAGKNLEWVRWDGDESQISKAKKIAEPKGPAVTELGNVELIVVPALRIDRSGYRLGQGGGYYDRTNAEFKKNKHPVKTVGVGYKALEVKEGAWRPQSHDQALDLMIVA